MHARVSVKSSGRAADTSFPGHCALSYYQRRFASTPTSSTQFTVLLRSPDKKRADEITGSRDFKDCAPTPCGGPLKERETSQAGMPLLAHLLFNRKAGCRYRRM